VWGQGIHEEGEDGESERIGKDKNVISSVNSFLSTGQKGVVWL
jgi:hypothetical protein